MADDHHRDLCGLAIIQVLGQPVDSLHIEMVGGLIENQQVMIGEQHVSATQLCDAHRRSSWRLVHRGRRRPADVRRSLASEGWRPTRGLGRRRL